MKERVYILPEKDIETLGAVRTLPGLKAAVLEGRIWLRGLPAQGVLPKEVRKLPAVETYFLSGDQLLFPSGHLTPTGKLPELPYQPLTEFLPLEPPVSMFPAEASRIETVPIRVAPSLMERAAAAILLPLDDWARFAITAPEVRLQSLKFAVSAKKQVLVTGIPLPPVPGKTLWNTGRIFLPMGYDLSPAVAAVAVQTRLNPLQDNWLLFYTDSTWEQIPEVAFVQATRSAVRRTIHGGPLP